MFTDVIRQVIVTSDASFDEYRIIQHSPKNLEMQFLSKGTNSCKEAIKQSIKQLCDRQNCLLPAIVFTDYKQQQPHEKLKRIERRFNLDKKEVA